MELISIISPCYNGEKYIERYLDSVLSQTYKNIELIIVDDASIDNTESIIKKYIEVFAEKNMKLIYIKQATNKGQAAAVNEGLKVFSGEYMMWMDSDDIFYPDAIEEKIKFLKCNPDYDFVLNEADVVKENDTNYIIGKLFRKKPLDKDDLFLDLINTNNVVFCPGTIFVKTKALQRVLPSMQIFESREGQNWQLMLPLAYSCKYGYIERSLFKYVVYKNSHSHKRRIYKELQKRQDNFVKLIDKTIDNIPDMPHLEKIYYKRVSHLARNYAKLENALIHLRYSDYLTIKSNIENLETNKKIDKKYDWNYFEINRLKDIPFKLLKKIRGL